MEQEASRTGESLFKTLRSKFRVQHNVTIYSLQYCKLNKWDNEHAEERMGRPQLRTLKCKYKEMDRHMKEQFISSLKDGGMIMEIIHELTSLSDTSSVTSEHSLVWTKRVEAQ